MRGALAVARRPSVWGLALLAVTWTLALTLKPWSDERINDFFYLRPDAAAFLHGHLPYSRRAFEYPPLAAPIVALPGVVGTAYDTYRLSLAALMFAFAAALLLLARRLAVATGGSETAAVAGVALAPLLLGALVRNHFDLAPVALTVAALLALVLARPRLGLGLLGAGAMTKLFPLAAAPVALAWLAGRGERRAAIRAGATLAVVLAAGVAVAVALSPSGALHVLRYHFDRPAQVESTPAVALLGIDLLGGRSVSIVSSYGSEGVSHPAAGIVTGVLAALGVAAVAFLAARAYARPGPRELVIGSLGAIAAFAAFGKVFSPQFALWIVPLLALSLAWAEWELAALCATVMLLTFLEFPFRYFDLVRKQPGTVVLVAARDLAMIAVVGLAAAAMRQGSQRQ